MDNKTQPSNGQNQTKTQVVHIARPINPEKPVIDDATKLKHEESVQAFSGLNLCESEYVITDVKRHPIGLFAPLALGFLFIVLSLVALFNYDYISESLITDNGSSNSFLVVLFLVLFMLLVSLVTYVAYFIYTNNKFYLTNECVIQEIQIGLFNHSEQTVSLFNVEDISFTQDNMMEQIFGFGTIRLCTEGDETVYLFTYVPRPKEYAAILNDAVEAFKNGRPVQES